MSSWVKLYTDGSAHPNPGRGGWAYLLKWKGHEKECSGSEVEATNNRMELLAIVLGLEAIKRPCLVTVYTDSQWCYYGAIGRNKRNKHLDLWKRIEKQKERHQEVMFNWVQAHTGHAENERVDKLARRQALRQT